MYNPITGVGAGSAPVVPLTFPFIDQSHVKATVDGAAATLTWTSDSEVTFASPVTSGAAWVVYRDTPVDQPLVTYVDGAVLTAADLVLANQQLRYREEELGRPVPEADLVAFMAALSGAIARTVAAKLGDRISVTDFGALGDGAADDTAAFTAALASGREVVVPHGNFRISPVVLNGLTSLRLRGAGPLSTKITLISSGTALEFQNSQWVHITDLSFHADGNAQSLANARGVEFNTGSENSLVERVHFYGFSLGGERQLGTADAPLSGHVVHECYFLGNGGAQLEQTYSNDFSNIDNQFGQLEGVPHADYGVLMTNAQAGVHAMNKHWNNVVGLKSVGGSFNGISTNRIELSDHENVILDGGSYINFTGNRVHTASQAGDGLYDNVSIPSGTILTVTGNTVFSWNTSYSRWGIVFGAGVDEVVYGKNVVRGFDPANAGPVSVDPAVRRFSGDRVERGALLANAAVSDDIPIHTRLALVSTYAAATVAPGTGSGYTYTVNKDGVASTTTITTSDAALSGRAATTSPQLLFDQGEFFSLGLALNGTPASADHRWYAIFVEY